MARKGLLKKIQPRDPDLARVEANVYDAVETLAKDHDVISSPTTNLITAGIIPPGVSVVVYTGAPSQTLTLPPANCLGANVASIVALLNTTASAVTVVPSRGDSVNGTTSLSVAATTLAWLVSNGVSAWLRNV